mgnify:CR=1 FL=1
MARMRSLSTSRCRGRAARSLCAPLVLGALVAAAAVALGIGFFSRQGTIKEDTAIGILFAAALSLGVAMISSIRSYAVDLSYRFMPYIRR